MATESTAYRLVLGRVIAARRAVVHPPLTQTDLANMVRVGQATISRIEAGTAGLDIVTFNAIAVALGTTPAALQEQVERALARTEQAARGAGAAPKKGEPWWQTALAVAGVIGLAGLAGFAVAALLEEEKPQAAPRKKARRG